MSLCTRTTGQHFLAGALSAPEEHEFTVHLETCPGCRAWLHEDAGDPDSWELARQLLRSDVIDLHTCDLSAPHEEPRPAPTTIDLRRQILPYLAPTDDPAMLGRLGPYEIQGIVGRGGMGIVLKGLDPTLRRNVAVKVLDPAMANLGIARQRFAREARAMAAVSHEHVVPIYGVDERQGLPYFVMEYVAGGTLEHRIQKMGALDLLSTVRIAMQIAEALSAAHAQGLVHRDIKPGNILLDSGTERVRVADFGLAQIASDTSDTRSGMITGTPQYMSPEQVRGETCDARSDLFSLGSVIYAMCAGHAPFRAQSVYGVMQRIVHDPVRPLTSQHGTVPQWLDQFIGVLLAKEAAERFDSAQSVANHLRAELSYLQNPAESSHPSRPWLRPTQHPIPVLPVPVRWVIGLTTMSVALLAAGWQFLPKSEHQPSTSNDRQLLSLPQATASNRAERVPLWSNDPIDSMQQQAARLEELTFRETPVRDPWDEQVMAIARHLQELELEPF